MMKNNWHEQHDAMKARLEPVLEAIAKKNANAQLLAVSKFHSSQEIQTAIDCGLTLFGENRPQELCEKFPALIEYNEKHEKKQISVHMIGTLQRNKVRSLLPVVSCIQSIDRLALLQEIEKEAGKIATKKIDVLFEYNTGEESKAGFTSQDDVFAALEWCEQAQHIQARGFMTMAPFTSDENVIRSSFRTLVNIAYEAQKRFTHFDLSQLSMGMSNDYEIALEEGSNLVRIGTALFGLRT